MTTYVVSINGRPYARFIRLAHVADFLRGNSGVELDERELAQLMLHTGRTEISEYLVEFSTRREV